MNPTEQTIIPLLFISGAVIGVLARFLPMSGWLSLILAFVPVVGFGLAQCFC